jgi:hypothetical protein
LGTIGVYIYLVKLQYARHAKTRVMQPTRLRESPKIIRFNIKFNKLDYTWGIPDDVLSVKFVKAVENAIESKIKNGLPIALYDRGERKAYFLYPDGSRAYVSE